MKKGGREKRVRVSDDHPPSSTIKETFLQYYICCVPSEGILCHFANSF